MLGACAEPLPAPTVLIVGRTADALSLDPARITDAESAEVTEQIFDHLVRYRRESTEIEPSLATAWDVSADGRVWTFHLRPDVRFHDGTPFDADAVVFSLDRQRDPHHPYHQADFTYWENTFRNIQAVEKVDPLTVRITIERPYAPFLANLAMFPVSIVSPTAVRKLGRRVRAPPRRHRPVPLRRVVAGRAHHARGQPELLGRRAQDPAPGVRRHPRSAPAPGRARGRRHRRRREPVARGSAVRGAAPRARRCTAVAGNNVGYLAMNMTHPPFDDVRVRRAVNFAINKTAIVQAHLPGARPSRRPAPCRRRCGATSTRPIYRYDPAEAMALLAEARYRPTAAAAASSTSWTRRGRTCRRRRRWRASSSTTCTTSAWTSTSSSTTSTRTCTPTQSGEHDLCLLGWSADNGDPDNFLYVLFDPENAEAGQRAQPSPSIKNAELHGILTWAQESSDRSERERFYTKAQDLIAREAPWVPLAHAEVVVAARAQRRRADGPPVGDDLLPARVPPMSALRAATPRRRASDRVRARSRGLSRPSAPAPQARRSCSPSRRCCRCCGASTVAIAPGAGRPEVWRARADRAHHARGAQPGARATSRKCSRRRSGSRSWRGCRDLLLLDPQSTGELLAHNEELLPRGLVEIADESGKLVTVVAASGTTARALGVADDAEPIRRALTYERRVTIARGRPGAW